VLFLLYRLSDNSILFDSTCTDISKNTHKMSCYLMSVLVFAISSMRLRASNFSSGSLLDSRIFRSRSSSLPCTWTRKTSNEVYQDYLIHLLIESRFYVTPDRKWLFQTSS